MDLSPRQDMSHHNAEERYLSLFELNRSLYNFRETLRVRKEYAGMKHYPQTVSIIGHTAPDAENHGI